MLGPTEVPRPGSFCPRFPFHMVWLATNACNARCLHCSSNSAGPSHDELTTKEAKSLIDELVECGVVDLGISGGEPLMRPGLFDIIEHAMRRDLSVGVGSNGTSITRCRAQKLAGLGIKRLQISLDGLAPQHEALRCWPGMYDRVLTGIRIALQEGLRTHVCCTITRFNIESLEAYAKFVFGLGVHRINFSRYVPTGRGSDLLDLGVIEWQSVVRRVVEIRDRYRGRMEIVSHLAQQILVDEEVADMGAFIGCQAGIGQGCVTANGTVYPCVLLPIPLGNIRERPFADIWGTSPVIRTLQARDSLVGACGACSYKSRCGGCRAVAFARTGNYLAADTRCWLAAAQAGAA